MINVSKDDYGNQVASHDAITLTAGVTSTEILKEDWNRIVYYVKASMTADKDEAIRWYRRAAEFGHDKAKKRLAKLLDD